MVVVVLALRGGGYDTVTQNALGLLAWLTVLITVAFARPPNRNAWLVGGSMLALTAWMALSTLWSESAERSFADFNHAATYLALFVATVIASQRLGGTRRIVDGLTVGMAVVIGLALLSRLEPSLFPAQELQQLSADVRPRLTYPLNYWNAIACLVAMAVPLFLHLATRIGPPAKLRAIGAALLPASGLVLYLTFSRGGILCALVAVGVFVVLSDRRLPALVILALGGAGAGALVLVARASPELNDGLLATSAADSQGHRLLVLTIAVSLVVWAAAWNLDRLRLQLPPRRARLLLAVGGGLALVLLLAVVASADLGSRLESFRHGGSAESGTRIESRYLSGSGNGRAEYWKSAFHAWEAHPIAGTGAGTWDLWWKRHATLSTYVRDSHSLVFDVASELGTIGLLALFAVFASVFWAGWRRLREEPPDPAVPALIALCAVFLVNTAVDWTWEITLLGGIFFVAAALLVARRPNNADEGEQAARRRYPGRLGRGVAVALIAWVAIFAEAIPLLSRWQVDRSQAAIRRGDLDGARKAAETARSIQPWAAGTNLQLAQALEVSGKLDDARRYASEAVRQEPTNWATWLVLARIESRAGNLTTGKRYLIKARSLNPRSSFWQRIDFQAGP